MDISALILGYNEEKALPRLFDSLKDIKDIVFLDHQSTDNTAKLAESLGARVFIREFPYDLAIKEDVKEFEKRFGYPPLFNEGDKITNASKERSKGDELCKNDWVLNVDCDEIVTWDFNKVQEKIAVSDVVNCRFNHTHNPDGTGKDWFQASKLYNKQKTWWIGRLHEVKTGYNLRISWCNEMVIDHWQVPRESRSKYIPFLEYAVLKDQDLRSFYYLGKEYYHYGYYEKAIKFLILYLKEATYIHEKLKSFLMLASAYWELGSEEEAWIYCFQALKLDPTFKDAYIFLSQISKRGHKDVWLKHAEFADEQHFV